MTVSEKQIARDLAAYLRENSGVCAEGNVRGWRWVRFHDGKWQAARYPGGDRLKTYVEGAVLDEEQAISWLTVKPVSLIPESEAFLWRPSNQTIWEDAEEQDVFGDADRCWWCGDSEQTVTLTRYQTVEDGDCLLCPDCHDSWERAGEIVSPAAEASV